MGQHSGKSVYELDWAELYLGMKVVSPNGFLGEIIKLNPEDRHPSIDFKWENGKESIGVFHLWCKKVFVQ